MKMTDKKFYEVWGEALVSNDRDAYVSDWALSSMWEDEPVDDALVDVLGSIWDAAHMSVRDICKRTGMTQAALAQRFCIPKRTVEDWCRGIAKPPHYVRLMMMEALGII